MKCPRCGTDHDLPSKEWPLSGLLCSWRAERPDEWIMDEFLSKSLDLEKRCRELERERDELRDELETMRLRLAACGVAALTNTEESRRAQMIDISNPYYSASYQDVLNAVEREMKLRADNATLRKRLEPIEAAAIALVQRLELDKDVKKNNWWLNERAKIMEVIDDNGGCDEN